jgi:hypothetical protein
MTLTKRVEHVAATIIFIAIFFAPTLERII